jgi:hypothetical protein
MNLLLLIIFTNIILASLIIDFNSLLIVFFLLYTKILLFNPLIIKIPYFFDNKLQYFIANF